MCSPAHASYESCNFGRLIESRAFSHPRGQVTNRAETPLAVYIIGCMPSFFPDLLIKLLWMCGITPPPAMVALIKVSNSSSPRMANCKCLGVIRFTFKSLEALPANSRTSERSKTKYQQLCSIDQGMHPNHKSLMKILYKCDCLENKNAQP